MDDAWSNVERKGLVFFSSFCIVEGMHGAGRNGLSGCGRVEILLLRCRVLRVYPYSSRDQINRAGDVDYVFVVTLLSYFSLVASFARVVRVQFLLFILCVDFDAILYGADLARNPLLYVDPPRVR